MLPRYHALGLVLAIASVHCTVAAELPTDYLVAVSLHDVIELQEDFPGQRSLWITSPVAVITDGTTDVILVGKRDEGGEPLTLDDIILAVRARTAASMAEAPGVSIEPPGLHEKQPFVRIAGRQPEMVVRYTGGIEGTSLGLLFFKTDMLLKLLGMGYEVTGIDGLPSEWDIDIHQTKRGRRISPWDDEPTPSFFFPASVQVVPGAKAVALGRIDLRVMVGEKDRFHTMLLNMGVSEDSVEALRSITLDDVLSQPREDTANRIRQLLPDTKQQRNAIAVVDYVRKHASKETMDLAGSEVASYEIDDLGAQVTFAKLLTDNMEALKRKYPILRTYEARLGLLALIRQAERIGISDEFLSSVEELSVSEIDTPTRIPDVQRNEMGLGYSYGVTGGLSFLVEDARDGSPDAIRDLTLLHRPKATDAIVWIVPLTPDSENKPFALNTDPSALVSILDQTQPAVTSGISTPISLDEENAWEGWVNPHYPDEPNETPGWEPSTQGDNLVELSGELILGVRDSMLVRPDQLYVSPPSEIFGVSYMLGLKAVYENRLLFGVSVPFDVKLMSVPATPNLPGLEEFETIAGVSNPVLSASYLLYSDMYKEPSRWISLDAHYVAPVTVPVVEDDLAPVGLDGSVVYFGPSLGLRFSNNWSVGTSILRTDGSYEQPYERRVSGGYGSWVIDERTVDESGWLFTVNPSVRANSKWFDTIGGKFILATKDDEDVHSYELYFENPVGDRCSRVTAGLSFFADDVYYYFSWSLPIDFASFKRRGWSSESIPDAWGRMLQ